MNIISRTLTGGAMILVGLVLFLVPFFEGFKTLSFLTWVYGVPLLIMGLIIFFNKKEDEVEKIKKKIENVKGGRK